MNPARPRALALAALLLLPARAPSADVLLLKDGKRVEGEVSEQGDTYEVRTPYGTLDVRKEDVAKRLKSATALAAEIEILRKSAAEMADEGLKAAGDAAARNQKLEAAAALLEKAMALCGDGRQAFPDAGLDRVSASLAGELQKVRSGITPDALAPVAPPKTPAGTPQPAPPPTPAPSPAAAPDARKDPVPDPADQKRVEKSIRDLYRTEYLSRDPAARSALADKLLKEATTPPTDAATAFVLLREARDVAAEAGSVDTALEAIARMAGRFDVKADEMKSAALATTRRKVTTPDDLARVAEAYLALAEEQVRKGDFDGALKSVREAESGAKLAKDAATTPRASALVRDIPEMKRAHDLFAKAEPTLAASPEDPEANLVGGRYLCLVLNDWDAGLPLLAKGSQPALAQAAAKELDKPEDAAGQAKLADLWWDLAEKERNPFDRRGYQDRARSWYERAAPGATGLAKVRIEKRLAELEKTAGGAGASGPVDLLRLIDPAKDAVQGSWSLSGKVLVTPAGGRLQIPYVPPAEYDLTIVAEKKDVALFFVGLVAGGTQFSVLLDHNGSAASCIGLFGKGVAGEPSTFFAGEAFSRTAPSTVVCAVRRTGVVVTVDKRKLVEYRGDCRKLPLDSGWTVPDTKALAIGSNSPYHVSKIVLTPVSGQGRRLR